MKFSLVHPSRGRPRRAEEALGEWHAAATARHGVEHLLSVDRDDPTLAGYRSLAERRHAQLLVGDNRSVVDAVNRAARAATGDVLVIVSDDFGCPPSWDALLADLVGSRREAAVLVHDGIAAKQMTLPIVTRALYERIGYVYHPRYFSMFADDDLTGLALALGALVDARHLVFPHRHYSVGMSEPDATYERQNDRQAWWWGWCLYEKRRLSAFETRPVTPAIRVAQARVEAYYRIRTFGSRLRRRWLRVLPPSFGGSEATLRATLLRWLGRAAAVDPPV